MADISNLSNYLKDVADAIREKKGTEDQIPAANFDTEIRNLPNGGYLTQDEYNEAMSDLDYILGGAIPYTRLAYIDTSGTQYVNLNLNAFANMKMNFKFQYLRDNNTNYNCVLGGRMYTNNKNFGLFLPPPEENKWFTYSLSENNEIVDTNVTIPEDVDIFNTDIEVNIDNDQISIAMRGSSYTENVLCPVQSNPGYPIFLFGMNERNISCVDRSYVRFYELKVYNGDSLWRHYVPIVDDRAIPCIYEIITDTKLYNSGPGDFISGGVK